ncbi:MAG: hypothetical protein ABMA64_38860, partial [Myxococcota bacterium]
VAPSEVSPVLDVSSTTSGVVVTKEFLQKIPSGRTYQTAVSAAPGVKAEGRSGKKARDAAPAAAEPAAPAVAVTASSIDVVVPSVGAAVMYQHLLLPSDTAWVVSLEARQRRGSR